MSEFRLHTRDLISSEGITIDAQGNDTDIIFKGTDGGADITALTLDMSDAGKAIFNSSIETGGIIHMSGEQSSGPTQPSDGQGGYLYTKADGKIYWNSNEFAETSLLEGVISKGMTVQTKHTEYKDDVTASPASWAAIDNNVSSGYVVSITPTSASSKVLISVNCHIGVGITSDSKYYGLKLYRKQGASGSWAEVSGAVGNSDSGAETADACWITNNNYSGVNSDQNDIISNISGSYLDSPSTTDILYYTLYWKIKIGSSGSVSGNINLNKVETETETYEPRPISSITAQEIWDTGSTYTPNTGVININGSDVGIGTSSPGTQLQLESTAPYLTLKNSTSENTDGGCESKIIFKDHDDKTLAQIQASHDGTADDQKGDLIFYTNDGNDDNSPTEQMRIDSSGNVGIGTTNPTANLHIVHASNSSDYTNTGIKIDNGSTSYTLMNNNGNDLAISLDGTVMAYIEDIALQNVEINFTGQHRSILNSNITNTSVGLIVSTTGTFVNTDNTLNPSINESLPICVLSNSDNDKKVFGVISDKEDTESSREYSSGNFVSVYQKHNQNERRFHINSLGEGSMWVCNKNGTLENGEYINSTTVTGYGGKQTLNEEFLTRYTVAKITCDCDFSLTKIVKQKLKVTETTTDGETTRNIDYDSNGDVQYEDDLDENGNQQMVYKYETRFLQADGTQLTDEADYTTRLGNGESVYIACFVGCTYHCG